MLFKKHATIFSLCWTLPTFYYTILFCFCLHRVLKVTFLRMYYISLYVAVRFVEHLYFLLPCRAPMGPVFGHQLLPIALNNPHHHHDKSPTHIEGWRVPKDWGQLEEEKFSAIAE